MRDLHITLIQADQIWEDKEANLRLYEDLLQEVTHTDLILLPEMFHTSFTMNSEALAEKMEDSLGITWLKKQAQAKNAAFYTSLIIEEGGSYYNRGVFVEPSGSIHCYDKRKLFALAEEDHHFTAGNKETIVNYLGWKINLQICYDLRFPENCRNYEENGVPHYDLLLYVANWPERRIAHWEVLLPARAIENQCYVAAVNRIGTDQKNLTYNGKSKIINVLGENISNLSHSKTIINQQISYKELFELRKSLPFLRDHKFSF